MLEVLVALAIVTIALAASLRAAGSLAISSGELHQRLLAGFSADNVLAQLRLERAWPPIGSVSFACSQGDFDFVCTRLITATPNPSFKRVDVMVKSPQHDDELMHLVTVMTNESPR